MTQNVPVPAHAMHFKKAPPVNAIVVVIYQRVHPASCHSSYRSWFSSCLPRLCLAARLRATR